MESNSLLQHLKEQAKAEGLEDKISDEALVFIENQTREGLKKCTEMTARLCKKSRIIKPDEILNLIIEAYATGCQDGYEFCAKVYSDRIEEIRYKVKTAGKLMN